MKKKKKGVRVLLMAFLVLFVIGLFFLTPNMTGNAIGGLDNVGSNILGVVFIVLGVLGYYFVFKFLGSYL